MSHNLIYGSLILIVWSTQPTRIMCPRFDSVVGRKSWAELWRNSSVTWHCFSAKAARRQWAWRVLPAYAITIFWNVLSVTLQRGFTPLHIATKYGHLKVVRLLLSKGINPDVEGKNCLTALHVATHYNHVAIALYLLEKGASPHCATKVKWSLCFI